MSRADYTEAEYATTALQAFCFLAEQFRYKLISVTEKIFFVRLVYRNRWKCRKIVIDNHYFPGDHGFGFFIHKLWTNESQLLHNQWIPADKMEDTLHEIKNSILGYPPFISLIMGKNWKLKPSDFELYERSRLNHSGKMQ